VSVSAVSLSLSSQGSHAEEGSHSPSLSGVAGAVIETPLVHLSSLSRETGCDIYAKCEFMNPTGSVKDRAAFNLIREVRHHQPSF
jgi:cysteine synthase